MRKHILERLEDSRARVQYLRQSVEKLESSGREYVGDSVTHGRKGKKPLGITAIRGYSDNTSTLRKRMDALEREMQKLLELQAEAEEWIAGIENIEMRNIFSLRYVDDLNWVQVAHRMNALYRQKRYTESSCRQKHGRFLKNF